MNRRQLIKGIGAAIIAAKTPPFIPSLIQDSVEIFQTGFYAVEWVVGDRVHINDDPETWVVKEVDQMNKVILISDGRATDW